VSLPAGVDYLLNTRPNPEMGAFTFRELMLGHALLRGNAYAEIQRDNRGVVMALWPLHPDRVCPGADENGVLYYEVWNSTGNTERDAMDMFHVRGFGRWPGGLQRHRLRGAVDRLGSGDRGVRLDLLRQRHEPDGGHHDADRDDAGRAGRGSARDEAAFGGPKGERTAIFDASIKYEKVSTDPNDGQFIETRQHQIEEICRWFGVPPHKVMHLLRATFSNIEHQSIEVVVDSITPWAKRFEQEADYKLFGAVNRQGFYTKLSMQALLRGDNASRMAFYKGLFELGVTLNQILALEEMNGIGADGDVSFVSNNIQTLKRAIATPVKTVPKPGDTVPTRQRRNRRNHRGHRMQSCSIVPSHLVLNALGPRAKAPVAPAIAGGGYRVVAKGTEADIYLYGDIGDSWFGDGVTARQFAEDIKALGNVSLIHVRINSYGGDVFQGLTMYRLLVDHPARIEVHIDGVAASIASVIAMAGDVVHIAEAGFLMIHNAWGIALGDASEMRRTAELLDQCTASVRDVYVARTTNTAEAVKGWMDAETWFDGATAVERNFATDVVQNLKVAAKFDPLKHRGLKHAPAALAGTPNLDAARERIATLKLKVDRAKAA
jgi:HK97 family phage portal protein